KLGISGLIAAYRKTAENLVSSSSVTERRPGYIFDITCDYNYANRISSKKDNRLKIIEQEFTDNVYIKLFIDIEAAMEFEKDFINNNIEIKSKIESVN